MPVARPRGRFELRFSNDNIRDITIFSAVDNPRGLSDANQIFDLPIPARTVELKKMATRARLEAETFFGKKIFLEIFIKVAKDWRNNDMNLKHFGY